MSVLAELDTSLQALLALKAPGVTKSRIAAITTLCVENVKSESILVQKIFTHFKRAPATHKLGVLYVIDAVTRQWIEKAGMAGQDLSASAAQDGTFAAGVHKMNELLPTMINDLVSNAPYDQKDKTSKLIDIWERGNIFPADQVSSFKKKIEAWKPTATETQHNGTTDTKPSATHQSAIATAAPNQPVNKQPSELLSGLAGLQHAAASGLPPQTATTTSAQNSFPAQPTANPPPVAAQTNATITPQAAQALASVIPPNIANDPAALQQHLQVLQQLVQLGVPPEQWMTVIEAMRGAGAAPQLTAPIPQQQQTQLQFQQPPQTQHSHNRRDRSRSPLGRRNSPSYDTYQGPESYRQRSPGRSSTPSMQTDMNPLGGPKWTDFDPTLPEGHIRVLSRTLFIGGTTCGEDELRGIFGVYGPVQTCIPNPDKRHAFIKYANRAGAVTAKAQLSEITDQSLLAKVRSVKWGVGFGPRDCNDYASGVSVIPVDRLTEADRKWVLTAPYGGSGGKPITTGLVIEEPDIEIGAGVSSKAISRRVAGNETNRGRFNRGGDDNQRSGGRRQDTRDRNFTQRRSPSRQQPTVLPPQRYEPGIQPAGIPGYGMPVQGFYGLPPGQGGMHYG